MHIDEKQFKELLTETGLLSRSDVDTLDREARRKGVALATYLVTTGKMNAADVRRLEGQLLDIPFMDLSTEKIPFAVLSAIPEPIVRAHNITAFKLEDDVLSVAILSINALPAIAFLKDKQKLTIRPYFTNYESIKTALLQYQKELKKRYGDDIKRSVDSIKKHKQTDFKNTDQVLRERTRQSEDEATAILVETLIRHARVHHATDIQLEPMADHVIVRYRIGGNMHEAMLLAKDVLESVVSRMKFLSKITLDEQKIPQYGTFSIVTTHETISGHVAVTPTHQGDRLTITLRHGGIGLSLENLGLHGHNLELVLKNLQKRSGAVLVAGPRGSGVTTLLYGLLETINMPHVQSMTVEGTIEKTLEKATQILTRPELGFDTHAGLKTALKHHPDVLMIAELSTGEVAQSALRSAHLGRFVIAGVRTETAVTTIADLLAVGVDSHLLANVVSLVIGTCLVPSLGLATERYFLEKSEIKSLGKIANLERVLEIIYEEGLVPEGTPWTEVPFYRAKNKKAKELTTVVVGLHEIITMTPMLREKIVTGADVETIQTLAEREGMLTFIEDGIIKAVQGQVALEEVLKILSR